MESENNTNSPSSRRNWKLSDLAYIPMHPERKTYSNDINRGRYEDPYPSMDGYNQQLNGNRGVHLSSQFDYLPPYSYESDNPSTIVDQDEVSDYFLDLPDVVYDYSRNSSLHPYENYPKPGTSGGLLDLHCHSKYNLSNNLGSRGSQQDNQTSHRTAISQQHLHSSMPSSRDSIASSHRPHFSNNDVASYQPYGNDIDYYPASTPYPYRVLGDRYQETSRHLQVKSSPIIDDYPNSHNPYGHLSVLDEYDITVTQQSRTSLHDQGREVEKREDDV